MKKRISSLFLILVAVILASFTGYGLSYADTATDVQLAEASTEIAAGIFAGGSGTEADPWQIATAEQLDSVRDYLDGFFVLTADIDLSGYENWEPIGAFVPVSEEEEETPELDLAFTGTFDGGNHKISNVHILKETTEGVGLFGCVAGDQASIKNLIVENVDVTGGMLVAGVVGYSQFTNTIDSVSLIGENNITGGFLVGGIAGGGFSNIQNCSADANVTLVGDGAQGIGILAGGMETSSIIDSSATGTVTVTGDSSFSIGGLAGAVHEGQTVEDCQADVVITVGENNSMIGGLIGNAGTYDAENPTLISNASVTAVINAPDSAERIGGLVGGGFYLNLYKEYRPVPTILKIVDGKTSGSIDGGMIVGTIAGYTYNDSIVENSESTMTVNGATDADQIGATEETVGLDDLK